MHLFDERLYETHVGAYLATRKEDILILSKYCLLTLTLQFSSRGGVRNEKLEVIQAMHNNSEAIGINRLPSNVFIL